MCIVRACWWVAKTSSPCCDGIRSVKCQCIWCFHGFIHYCGSDACSVHVGMKTGISCLRVRESGTVASCLYFCLLIFTRLCLAWPWITGFRPQLHVSSVLVFFLRFFYLEKHWPSFLPPQRLLWRLLSKGKDQNRSFCPRTNYMHSLVDKDVVPFTSQAFFSLLMLWLKWLEEC